MKPNDLIKKYLDFFKEKKHSIISSASLIPEHDPTVLFTTAGMHPLVPYLVGQPHPGGKRLADVQKCIRTVDIDNVGDPSHLTFFQMLGNWSLGDYFKKEAIEWSYEFLTKNLNFNPDKISVTVFEGDNDAPKDKESAGIWRSLGVPEKRIYFLPKEDNWWGPAGKTGPCGPCTEMFIDTGLGPCSNECKPGCGCGKYFEVWNDVFLEYNKIAEGKFEKLSQKNVDTGMGVERTIAMLNKKKTVYETEIFLPIIESIKKVAKVDNYGEEENKALRVISDHLRASVFILGDEHKVPPSNLDQGYILRRFIRRSIRYAKQLGIDNNFCEDIAKKIIEVNKEQWPILEKNKEFIFEELNKEEEKFKKTLETGLNKFEKMVSGQELSGTGAFLLFQSYGFPIEMTVELAKEKGLDVDLKGFEEEFKKHQELSRVGAENRFKGGLADSGQETTKLHTATHLLNQALREVLKKPDIFQKGSNITQERLRFDFNFDRKLEKEELKKVEDWVNERIKEALPVKREELTLEEAKKAGAQGVFESKYGEKVFVYSIGNKSKEICGGPHITNTKELGHFKIKKEESSAAGIRRIKAVLE
ncbi:MAG: alanine--tRNA ligase [Nanoarchaeota archaeon]|nr:alanine--tRNA ligase [Nanoarchaeota archaeon]MBU1946935.1 alanine--tRNA ligase [Nanoarchaeota archaeon]